MPERRITPAAIETYLNLFCHRRDLFAEQRSSGAYFLRREPITPQIVLHHLEGRITAGFYPLGPDSTVRWVVLDADRADGIEQLQEAWKRLDQRGIDSSLELSRRGGHLWIFVEPIAAQAARRLVLGTLPALEDIEVFPKQDRLDNNRRVGNLVRGPLGIHRLTGKRYPFVNPISLAPVARSVSATLEYLARTRPLPANYVAEQLVSLPARPCPESSARPVAEHQVERPGRSLSPIERLKTQIGDPYEFIAGFVELDEAGRGRCPFHPPDHHPSFAVHRGNGYWVDFHEVNPRTGRYVGGDAIEFYRRLRGLSYKEAIQQLSELLTAHGES